MVRGDNFPGPWALRAGLHPGPPAVIMFPGFRSGDPVFRSPSREVPLTDNDCLFCRIASGEISADLILETSDVLAFRDINPQAPTHILIIPREHIPSVSEMEEDQAPILGKLFLAARDLARKEGIQEGGYRMVVNAGSDAGQSVFHVHMHLLGGREMKWPPG